MKREPAEYSREGEHGLPVSWQLCSLHEEIKRRDSTAVRTVDS
jgi:hypothetical protein